MFRTKLLANLLIYYVFPPAVRTHVLVKLPVPGWLPTAPKWLLMKAGAPGRLAIFDGLFNLPDLIWIELDGNVIELATELRARFGLRTPAALQAACCLQLGSEHRLLTGDRGFQTVDGLHSSAWDDHEQLKGVAQGQARLAPHWLPSA